MGALLKFKDVDGGRVTTQPLDGYDYRIVGGGNDYTVYQQRVATRGIVQRQNCRSVTEAERIAHYWARDLILERGPW